MIIASNEVKDINVALLDLQRQIDSLKKEIEELKK